MPRRVLGLRTKAGSSTAAKSVALLAADGGIRSTAGRTDTPSLIQHPSGLFSSTNLVDMTERATSLTARDYLSSLISTTAPEDLSIPPAPCALLFRGLRVRIGLHSGLTDPASITPNPNNGHLQYGGVALATTMSVCGAGHGGMVLMSGATFSLVRRQHVMLQPASLNVYCICVCKVSV